MYHISDLKKFLRCERLYLYSKDTNNAFKPYLRMDENINDIICKYFGIEDYFEGIRNDNDDKFINNIDKYEWYFHPRLSDGELRFNVPLMHKNENNFDLYYFYYGTQIRELDLLTYRISLQILNKKGFNVENIYVIYMNEDYVNEGELDVYKLLKCVDIYKEKRIIDLVKEKQIDYEELIDKMAKADLDKPAKKCKYCKLNSECEFYDKCFPDEKEIEDDSILTLVSSKYKNQMYENNILHLKDVDTSLLEGNKVQYAQIMASKNNGVFIDKLALSKFLESISGRPISFIDFEWDRMLIPIYPKMKPMDVVCFEFALYYIDENGHMEHRTFVATGDCRKEFIEALIEYLPEKGPILAYNAIGAECLRLEELGRMFPEYKDRLDQIISRFVDLATPFTEGLFYDTRMRGNYSLKRLVDICSDYSYADLDIYDGMEAVYNWRDIDKGNKDDKDRVISELKEYCSLDAYGLFLVYKWLVKITLESK